MTTSPEAEPWEWTFFVLSSLQEKTRGISLLSDSNAAQWFSNSFKTNNRSLPWLQSKRRCLQGKQEAARNRTFDAVLAEVKVNSELLGVEWRIEEVANKKVEKTADQLARATYKNQQHDAEQKEKQRQAAVAYKRAFGAMSIPLGGPEQDQKDAQEDAAEMDVLYPGQNPDVYEDDGMVLEETKEMSVPPQPPVFHQPVAAPQPAAVSPQPVAVSPQPAAVPPQPVSQQVPNPAMAKRHQAFMSSAAQSLEAARQQWQDSIVQQQECQRVIDQILKDRGAQAPAKKSSWSPW